MGRLFLFGWAMGLAGVLAAAHLYPWVAHERLPSLTSVVSNGGRAETFLVRLPVDRVAMLASTSSGLGGMAYPPKLTLPPAMAEQPARIEHFKLRATDGSVIGLATRHWTLTASGPAVAWSLTIPGRGTVMLAAPGQSADYLANALRDRGYTPGSGWDGNLRLTPIADAALTQTVAGSDEFEPLEMSFTETWTITGVDAEDGLRGTIVLNTIGRGS